MKDFTDRRVKQILKANTENKYHLGDEWGEGVPCNSPRSGSENSMMQQLPGKYFNSLKFTSSC